MINQTDAKNQTIGFQYDALNRLKRKTYPSGTDTVFTYDQSAHIFAKGRLTTMTDASGMTQIFYDDRFGRNTRTVKTVDGTSYSFTKSMDELGRIKSIRYPDGEKVVYSYDSGGNLKQVGGYVTYSNYNALGRPGSLAYGNGVITTYQYEPDTQRMWSINTTSSGTNLLSLEYEYYQNGNIQRILNYVDATRTQNFGYDTLNRLKMAQSAAYGTLGYDYDEIGNIQSKEGIGYSYNPNPNCEVNAGPHAVTATTDGRNYCYDANGNMLSDGQRTFGWDYDNRPESITYGDPTSFVYDGFGSRVKKIGPAGTTVYIGKLYECSGGICAKYIFAGGERIALKSAVETYYYHVDHLGSTGVVTNSQGSEVENIFYMPFGASLLDYGSISVNHKYTGQEFDPETGLYYYNARYYNPALGRFISPDIFVPSPFNTQSFNRYSYVLNNPINYYDPTGHSWVSKNWRKFKRWLEKQEYKFERWLEKNNGSVNGGVNYNYTPGDGGNFGGRDPSTGENFGTPGNPVPSPNPNPPSGSGSSSGRDSIYGGGGNGYYLGLTFTINNYSPGGTSGAITAPTGMPHSLRSGTPSGYSWGGRGNFPRLPDYFVVEISAGYIAGWSGMRVYDRYGNIYQSPIGFNVGKSPGMSGSLTAGWYNSWEQPTEQQLLDYFNAWSLNVDVGYGLGGGFSGWGYDAKNNSTEVGLVSPQFGVSLHYLQFLEGGGPTW